MKIKSGYEIKSVEGVNIVVPTEGNMSFSGVITLNETALFVWNLLKENLEKEEIVNRFVSEYDAPRDVIESDVDELLKSFIENGLIEE